MAATDTIGVAFLGVGRMGETHLRNIAGLHGVRVIAVADPRPEAAKRGKALANADTAVTLLRFQNGVLGVAEIQG